MNDIVVDAIRHSYGDHVVLKDVSYRFPAGSRTAIVGPSGSGKTTLLYLLMGLLTPDSGRIIGMPSSFSVVFQEDRLSESLTVEKNLRLVTGSHVPSEQLEACLAEFGMPDMLSRCVGTLSGGMKRRVALSRALLFPSSVFLLDEPFNGLDPDCRKQVIHALAKKTEGATVIFVTHDRSEAELFGATIWELPPS